VRFFLDNCLPPRFAPALRILAEQQKFEIVHLSERFPRDTADPEWIASLAHEGGWVIVSGDPRISKGRVEQAAWHESGMTAFFFGHGWASQRYWNQAADIVRWWPRLVLEAQQAVTGTGYLIPLHGKELQRIYTPGS
jgi:hypothetical protein